MKSYRPPSATYRLQFHAGFTFQQLLTILDYLHDLGISTIYASPVFKTAPGNENGYNITDPHQINPAIGTIEELRTIHQQLQQKQMTWLQDIVPNHMAYHTTNTRLYDVMERGPLSPYYEYFDIDWHHPDLSLAGKVMAPFLGKTLKECVKDGEIKLAVTTNGFTINYFEQVFPLSVAAYDVLLTTVISSDALPFNKLITSLYQQATIGTSTVEWTKNKQKLLTPLSDLLYGIIERVNNNPTLLLQIIQQQYYQLTKWNEADSQINYRRFFIINELITLRMEAQPVFDEYHTFLHSLYRQELIQGLRIDHIDGLKDPAAYIHQLRQMFGSSCYIIAEKILESHESFPSDWSLQGTSGYEFLSYTNHLLSNNKGAAQLRRFYKELLPSMHDYKQTVYEKKRLILEKYMAGEWENLVRYCYTLKLADAHINHDKLKEALGLFMICLPVYRLYPAAASPLEDYTLDIVRQTFELARAKNRNVETEMALLESCWEEIPEKGKARSRMLFIQRLMQFTGPLTAKGVEDTAFYVYNPLLSFNEVGDSPDTTDFSLDTFHKRLQTRQQYTPQSLNTTATHDTKRGEDARIRINMLTLLPREWKKKVNEWREMNGSPLELNDEYFIYQSIIAGFPSSGVVTSTYIERLQQYFIKAAREAKISTSWSNPSSSYEDAGTKFIHRILSDKAFLDGLQPFLALVDEHAFTNSLVQVLIKITAPGIPDIYQGCELWDYSYVDPDNRRPVDYTIRKSALAAIRQKEQEGSLFPYLTAGRSQGLQKLFTTWKALHCRKEHADLFIEGDYLPLQSSTDQILAYARTYRKQWAVIITPLPGSDFCGTILLPTGAPSRWRNIFTGEIFTGGALIVADVLKQFPVALLVQ
ncbi:maltooligosyl trehalose synthase [Chitinophaga sp. CF118]|uniref:malto-oligosyltrehalose synthase n=1 Tax=Chitinophaga sp. CF118 TaxID=1884367 RepID=UPI0008E232C5|nr:malto-oligosyltrehalose synthase [Chitinophaga sp. CF118]SFE40565.1 maltooligosyl trehalose synthase [Chitinophaga sp. CF118]